MAVSRGRSRRRREPPPGAGSTGRSRAHGRSPGRRAASGPTRYGRRRRSHPRAASAAWSRTPRRATRAHRARCSRETVLPPPRLPCRRTPRALSAVTVAAMIAGRQYRAPAVARRPDTRAQGGPQNMLTPRAAAGLSSAPARGPAAEGWGAPMTLISRRQTLFLGGAAALPLAGLGEGAGDPVRKIILYSDTQGAVPQS